MADFYKILKADPLGEPWTPNKPGAKPIQNYWCQVEGQDWAVNVGRQVDNPLRAGQHIYGDLTYAKSQKGTEYWKFKGQKVPDDVARPTDDPATPAQATAQAATGTVGGEVPGWAVPLYNMVTEMHKIITGNDFDEPEPAKPAEPATGVEVLSGEVDEETQQTLDNIFSPPETPEDK